MFDREPRHRAEHWALLGLFLLFCWWIGANPITLIVIAVLAVVGLIMLGIPG